jgi:hypothetical protein
MIANPLMGPVSVEKDPVFIEHMLQSVKPGMISSPQVSWAISGDLKSIWIAPSIDKVFTLRNRFVETYRKTYPEQLVSRSTILLVCICPMFARFLVPDRKV